MCTTSKALKREVEPTRLSYFQHLILTTALYQLILKKGLVAMEGQENNVLYKYIEIGADIRIGDVGQPNILVPLTLT